MLRRAPCTPFRERRGCRRRWASPPPRLSRRAAHPRSGVHPPRSESRPKRTSSRSRGVLYFGSADGAVGRIYSVPNPRATPQANEISDPGSTPPLLLNPILARQGAYPLLRLDERRMELEKSGTELFDFGTGDPRERTDEGIRQALMGGVPKSSRYPSTAGKRELRESFCGWMRRRHGVALDPDSEVLPATGSKEAIFHAPLAFLHHSHERRGVAYG